MSDDEVFPPCKHCKHPGDSHDDEFGNCGHLGITDTGWDVCECPGYEEQKLEDFEGVVQ